MRGQSSVAVDAKLALIICKNRLESEERKVNGRQAKFGIMEILALLSATIDARYARTSSTEDPNVLIFLAKSTTRSQAHNDNVNMIEWSIRNGWKNGDAEKCAYFRLRVFSSACPISRDV